MTDAKKVNGGCLCGIVRYEAQLPSKWCAHCHCSMCRRFHGAGYVTWAGFPLQCFKVLQGEEALKWFESSEGAQRGFCAHCGSSLLFRSDRWPDEMHVALGTLNQPIDKLPQAHVYHEDHVAWVAMDDNLPGVTPDT